MGSIEFELLVAWMADVLPEPRPMCLERLLVAAVTAMVLMELNWGLREVLLAWMKVE